MVEQVYKTVPVISSISANRDQRRATSKSQMLSKNQEPCWVFDSRQTYFFPQSKKKIASKNPESSGRGSTYACPKHAHFLHQQIQKNKSPTAAVAAAVEENPGPFKNQRD